MKIQAIEIVINKLKARTEPLGEAECHALGDWLDRFIALHDEKLLRETIMEVHETKSKERN